MSKLFEKDVIVIDCRSTKQKVEDLKWKAKDKLHSAGEWCNRNKEWLYFIVPIAVPMATSMIKGSIKKRNLSLRKSIVTIVLWGTIGHLRESFPIRSGLRSRAGVKTVNDSLIFYQT